MLANKLMSALSGGAEEKLYVDDVFSTYLYTGNGATQTINNGIDLVGKGGLVWIKQRNGYTESVIFDSSRSLQGYLSTNLTSIAASISPTAVSLNNNGFSLPGGWTGFNNSGSTYASWTFRKAPKFFDVVTYTGDGVNGRLITHSLGNTPGMIIVKRVDAVSNWIVRHRGDGITAPRVALNLATPDGGVGLTENGFIGINSISNFAVWKGSTDISAVNASGGTYVAYIFAHDTSTDGIIQCGSFTTDGSGNATVNLGWEPQYVMLKASSTSSNWITVDVMRGMPVGAGSNQLYPNTSGVENASSGQVSPNSTGFTVSGILPSSTVIYLAIRRPNKPPKSGAEVYNGVAYTSDGTANRIIPCGFPVDMILHRPRLGPDTPFVSISRLMGTPYLNTSTTAAESAQSVIGLDVSDGIKAVSPYSGVVTPNYGGAPYNTPVLEGFRRAPGFMDVVCYAGDSNYPRSIQHNLTVAPELVVIKSRTTLDSGLGDWEVKFSFNSQVPYYKQAALNKTDGAVAVGFEGLTNSSVFQVTPSYNQNSGGTQYVAYLFASLPGISKVGSYTGNGTAQTINCGFSTGARFILIKRTDSAGDWYVWDTARGIVAANDPHLSLNTTAVEIAADDSVDPDASGFIVNQNTATNINVSGGQYIFLAIA